MTSSFNDDRKCITFSDNVQDAVHRAGFFGARTYRFTLVVDEVQDMGTQAFRLLRHLVPEGKNDLFIVGEGHQRIYRHKVVLGQ